MTMKRLFLAFLVTVISFGLLSAASPLSSSISGTVAGKTVAGKWWVEDGTSYIGYIYYTSQGSKSKLMLQLEWINSTELMLSEYYNGRYTGKFQGTYNSRNVYSGTYTRADGRKFSFSLNISSRALANTYYEFSHPGTF